jgi:subtilisin family serine protease
MAPRRHLSRLLLILGLAIPRAGLAASPAPPHPYVPGRIVLKLSADLAPAMQTAIARARGAIAPTGSAALDALIRRHRGQRMRAPFAGRPARAAAAAARFPRRAARATPGADPGLERIFILDLAPDLDSEQAALEYARLPGVAWAEPDRIAEAAFVPNDPYFASSGAWGQPYRDLWGLVAIAAPAAWDVTRGAGVIVAISDTGIDAAHPDIASRMWTNPGEIPGNGLDDDGNGFVDDVHGWDFVNDDNDPFDDNGHGTHVAGTVAASGDNALGVVGVAWESSVMAVKGLGAGGSGGHDGLAAGIVYAADNGADVINASWGGVGSQLLADTIAAAHAAGVVFVAAAGNGASSVADFSPANVHEAIAVAASDHTDQLASFSNFGTKIDVAAPGGGDVAPPSDQPSRSILSLRSSGSQFDTSLNVSGLYTRLSGTSMAAPHVSGAAALVLAVHPEFKPEQVRQTLRVSADDIAAPGFDVNSGYGRLNVGQAVLLNNVPLVEITSPASGTRVAGVLTVAGTAAGSGFAEYTLEYGNGSLWNTIVGPVNTPVESDVLGTLDLATVPDGQPTLRLRVRNTDGVWFEDRVTVVLDNVIIDSPAREDVVGIGGSPIEIRGTAAGALFQSYLVQYRLIAPDTTVGPWISTGVSLTGGGASRVSNGLLATIDPAALPGPRDIDIRLRVDIGPLNLLDVVEHVIADPTLRPGWPRRVAPIGYPVSPSVTLADLDGDGGKEILLVANYQLVVLRADGSDLPGWPRPPLPGSGFLQAPPSVADLDGDGSPEVVTPLTNGIDVRRADGTPLAPIITSGFPPQGTIALADLDGDGRRDLVYSAHTSVRAVRTDGTSIATITRGCASLLQVPCFEKEVAVGDIDGDGHPELAVIGNDLRRKQYLHLHNADGTARPRFPRKISHRQRVTDNLPIMADIDGNGSLEVACNDDSSSLTVYDGAGRKRRYPRRSKLPEFEQKGRPTFRSEQEPVTAGDLNGDGFPELLVAQSFPETILKKNDPPVVLPPPYNGQDFLIAVAPALAPLPGVWSQTFFYPRAEKTYGPGTSAIGDIDGDGQQDVVIGSGTCAYWGFIDDFNLRRCYTVYAFRPDASLMPGFPKPTAKAGKSKLSTPALGDLDGDGLQEIVWIDDNNDILVWTVPGTPGPENMQWPMYRHDAAHTGALPAHP